ncbi:MAG: DNA repair protein RecN, partial [Rickettsiales bacterium]|nr:DNA repair protein RecN [Rickettsiales bacterium]
MLQQLSIRNIVLIEALDVSFRPGFCVLTGETGAGKSIILDALGLVLGSRAESRLLRAGTEQGSVTATFAIQDAQGIESLLKESGISIEKEIIIRRVLCADGKSKAFLNDAPVSIGLLQRLGEALVEIHGQQDQRGLLNPEAHRRALDAYAGLQPTVQKVQQHWQAWREIVAAREALEAQIAKAEAERDYITHVCAELDQLAPQPGEEEALATQRARLMQREKILEAIQKATESLEGPSPVTSALRHAETALVRSGAQDETLFESALAALDRASAEVMEALDALERAASELMGDDAPLDAVEERLFALRAVARKYRRPVEELPAYREEVAASLATLDAGGKELAALQKQEKEERAAYLDTAARLTEGRTNAAKRMEKAVEKELGPLKMGGSKVRVAITPLPETAWSGQGCEQMVFEVQTNPGSLFGPLHKIASGGELSRFMLALKV